MFEGVGDAVGVLQGFLLRLLPPVGHGLGGHSWGPDVPEHHTADPGERETTTERERERERDKERQRNTQREIKNDRYIERHRERHTRVPISPPRSRLISLSAGGTGKRRSGEVGGWGLETRSEGGS